MTSTRLEYAERRMQQKWYDLVTAEQQGASPQTLERMYNAYMLAVEEYNHCSAVLGTGPAHAHTGDASASAPSHPTDLPRAAGRRRQAS